MKLTSVLRSKTLIIATSVIVLFYLFAWAGLPRIVHWQAEAQIKQRSGHILKMGQPEINPFALTIRIPDLTLHTPAGEQLVAFEHLFINVSGTDLFTGLLGLDQIDLKGLDLNVALLPEGRHNFSDLLDAFKNPEPEEPSEPPAFLLSHLLISHGVLNFEDRRKPEGLKTRFEPLDLELRDLATRSEQDGNFVLNAATGLGGQLSLRAQIQAAAPSAVGELSLKGLDIAKLEPVLKPVLPTAPPTGNVDVALNFDINLESSTPTAAQARVIASHINVEVREFNIAAGAEPTSPAARFAQLNIHNGMFDLQANKLELDSIALNKLQLEHNNKTPAIELNSIEAGPVAINLTGQHAQVGSARINGGQINLTRNPQGELDLMAAIGAWTPAKRASIETSETPATEAPEKPWTYAVDNAAIAGLNASLQDLSLKPALNLGLRNIAIQTSGITQNLGKPLPLQAGLDVQSGGSIAVNGNLTPASAAAQLNVDIKGLDLKMAQPFIGQFARLDLTSGTIDSQGKASYNAKQQDYSGSFTLANLRLNETGTNKPFLQFKRLFTPGMTANAKGLNIQRLNLEGLDTAMLIAKDKSSNISRILVKKENAKESAPDKPDASPAFLLNIQRFNLSKSKLDFADESLFIPFGTRIHNLEGVLNGLSNKPGSRGELVLKGDVDEFGEADARGRLNLLDPTAYMDIAVKFNNVEMGSLTPYSGTFANRKIESGKLSLNLNYQIENQQLNSSNQVIIDKLTLGERVESPQGRDLPLELAIAILQDSNGRIDLGLPIRGNLNDPEFSYGAIVWKAIGNVLNKIVTTPFRALGSLFGGAGDDELGNVAFAAGANTLSPSQKESLKKLGIALKERPNLALTVQGTWADKDKTSIQALQLRRAVAIQAGDKLQTDEDPGPLAFNNETTQKAIEALFEKRLGSDELAAMKAGFRKANPGELEQNAAGKALGQINKLFKEPRTLSEVELNALKGKNFYAVLGQKLQDNEEVTNAQLQMLATQRQEQITAGLAAVGIAPDRLAVGAPKETQANEDQTVSVELGVAVNK